MTIENIRHRLWCAQATFQVIVQTFPKAKDINGMSVEVPDIGTFNLLNKEDELWFEHRYYSMRIDGNEDLLDLADYLQCLKAAIAGDKN